MVRQLNVFILALAAASGIAACGNTVSAKAGQDDVSWHVALKTIGGGRQAVLPGRVTVLSFVDSGPDSRSQIGVLKSMQEQFGSHTQIVVVPIDSENPVNLYYDWDMGGIRVATGGPALARTYRVTAAPVTFLISANGVTLKRINGIADAPRLSFPLQSLFPSPSATAH